MRRRVLRRRRFSPAMARVTAERRGRIRFRDALPSACGERKFAAFSLLYGWKSERCASPSLVDQDKGHVLPCRCGGSEEYYPPGTLSASLKICMEPQSR